MGKYGSGKKWNSEKVLHEGLWRGGWNWPRGRSSEASLILSEEKNTLKSQEEKCSTDDWKSKLIWLWLKDWGLPQLTAELPFCKILYNTKYFIKQRYFQWNIKSTPEYWESAAWLPGWGLPRLRLFPLQLNTTAVGEAAGILCTSLCYLSSAVFSMQLDLSSGRNTLCNHPSPFSIQAKVVTLVCLIITL